MMTQAQTASGFQMQGARAAMDGGLLHIQEQVKAIESAIDKNPGLAFDLARTLIESVSKTILTERGIAFDPEDDLPKLFKSVTNQVPFLPPAASGVSGARKSLKKTLNGLHTAVLGVCELRNTQGFASHGTGEPRPSLERMQALLVAHAADTIVGFLHRAHQQDRLPPPNPNAEYDANPDFNDYVDQAHGSVIRIFEAEFKPSAVLFQMEPETYRIYLADYQPEPSGEGESGAPTVAEATP